MPTLKAPVCNKNTFCKRANVQTGTNKLDIKTGKDPLRTPLNLERNANLHYGKNGCTRSAATSTVKILKISQILKGLREGGISSAK